jgi:hypothetical protein
MHVQGMHLTKSSPNLAAFMPVRGFHKIGPLPLSDGIRGTRGPGDWVNSPTTGWCPTLAAKILTTICPFRLKMIGRTCSTGLDLTRVFELDEIR